MTTRNFLLEHPDKFDLVIFCLFDAEDRRVYRRIVQEYFPPCEEEIVGDEGKGKNEGVREVEVEEEC